MTSTNTNPEDNEPDDQAPNNLFRVVWIFGSIVFSLIARVLKFFDNYSAKHQLFGGLGVVGLVAVLALISNNGDTSSQTSEPPSVAETATEQIVSTDEPTIEIETTLAVENTNTAPPITDTPNPITQPPPSAETNLQLLITQNYFVIYVISETSLADLQVGVIDNDFERPVRTIVDDVPLIRARNNIASAGYCIMYTFVQNPDVGAPNQCIGDIQRIVISADEMFWWIAGAERQLQVGIYRDGTLIEDCDITNSGGACSFNY